MHAFLAGINGVVYARIARFRIIVENENVFAVGNVKHGHAVNGRSFGGISRGIENVVGSYYDCGVRGFEFGIDIVHFVQILVFDVGLAQQYVHMAGHTTRNGMNCVFDFRAARNQFIRKLFYEMLRLRDCHSVSGYDDDFFCAVKTCRIINFGIFFGFNL